MKKILLAVALLFSIGNAKEPEFDGAYLIAKNGTYKDVAQKRSFGNPAGYFRSYCTDEYNLPKISKKSIKYLLVKGNYNFTNTTFYKAFGTNYNKGKKEYYCFDTDSNSMDFRKKSANLKAYYDISKFPKGKYVAKIGAVDGGFYTWYFEIK